MEKVDILIIGSGVIGLAIARELSYCYQNIVVVEKNKSFGQETSSRNSEVIHGGMYYPCGTLKADLCIKGRRLLYQFCEKNKLPFKKTGKLIVATHKDEMKGLEAIAKQGEMNGVEGLRFLSQTEINRLEPNALGIAAIYSQETGIIDSHRLMDCFLTTAQENGVLIVYDAQVTAIRKNANNYKILIKNGGEDVDIETSIIINCAGLDSDTIAEMAGIDIRKEKYNLHYCKGQYFRVAPEKCGLIKHLVYPVPRPKGAGLGVHATLDLSASMRLGPDDRYLEDRTKDYSVDENKRSEFYQSVVKFLPFIEESDLAPDSAGIRPKLQPEGGDFRDFIICEESAKGLSGLINLIGIESPGLTASMAIARYVKDNLLKDV